jgi:hypothetical protein
VATGKQLRHLQCAQCRTETRRTRIIIDCQLHAVRTNVNTFHRLVPTRWPISRRSGCAALSVGGPGDRGQGSNFRPSPARTAQKHEFDRYYLRLRGSSRFLPPRGFCAPGFARGRWNVAPGRTWNHKLLNKAHVQKRTFRGH